MVLTNYVNQRSFGIILLFAFVTLYSKANTYSIAPKEVASWSTSAIMAYNRTQSQSEVIWKSIVHLNTSDILRSDILQIELDHSSIEVRSLYRNEEGTYSYIHFISADNLSDVYVSVLDSHIDVSIHTEHAVYTLTDISENEGLLAKYEFEDIPEEPENMGEITIPQTTKFTNEPKIQIPGVPLGTSFIRVLMLYTNSSLSQMPYFPFNGSSTDRMRMMAYEYINKANESFANSYISAHLQLAYLGATDYNESNHTWTESLNYFCANSDGYMDEVHALRDKYAADICILFIDIPSNCGEVYEIQATDNTAFCMVYPGTGCFNKFSAIHEIGHIVGCRHNMYHDNTLTPYQYGHGYCPYIPDNGLSRWRTMMAYTNRWCENNENNCKRILYWSNPLVSYNSMETGTIYYENNARVWNERASIVSTFRTKSDSITLTAYDNNAFSLYESYEAEETITAGAGYEIQSGQTIDMVAANHIHFLPGTHIKAGSTFRASISHHADGTPYPQFTPERNENNALQSHSIYISPNPVTDVLTFRSTESMTQVRIYNLSGQCVLSTQTTIPSSLPSNLQMDVSTLPVGLYLLQAKTADGATLQTKFIKK